mgnify:CR=1 FL=1
MQLPPELNEYWKSYARSNPGRGLSGAEIGQLNQKFSSQKQYDDREAKLIRRDLELYQQNWEEISGTNTQAPEYIPGRHETHYPGSKLNKWQQSNYSNTTRNFLRSRADDDKRRQRRMAINKQKEQEQRQRTDNAGFADPNWRNNSNSSNGSINSPSMQNPFQF